MKAATFITLSILLAAGTTANAQARKPGETVSRSGKKHRMIVPVQREGEPKARIRGVRDAGLTPIAFAKWLSSHPRLMAQAEPVVRFQQVSAATRLLNRTAQQFSKADRDNNGRVSPEELADYVAPPAVSPRLIRA